MKFLRMLSIFLSVLIFNAPIEAEEESKGGFGGLLKRFTEPAEKEGEELKEPEKGGLFDGLIDQAKAIGSESLKRGKETFDDFTQSGSEANGMIESLLGYVDGKLAGREPSYSEEEIQQHAVTLIPLIEKLNDRKFEKTPEVKSVGTFQMIQILARDLVPQYEKKRPEDSRAMIYLRSYLSAGLFAPSLLGKYGVEDGTVYILPQNITAVLEESEVDPALEEKILQIVIGHELTHGLQDQEVGLNESIFRITAPDAMQAFNATIEGHAVFMQTRMAKELGYDQAAEAAIGLLKAPELEEDTWLFNRVAMASAVQWEQIYLGGSRFVDYHIEEGGIEKIWSILENPPSLTAMITRPETYTEESEPLPDYRTRFAFAKETAKVESWNYLAEPMGSFQLQSCLATLPREQRESAAGNVREAVTVSLTNPLSIDGEITILAMEFDSAESAEEMLETTVSLNEQTVTEIENGDMVELISKGNVPYEAGEEISGTSLRFVTDAFLLGETTSTVVQCSRGKSVVQIAFDGEDLKKPQVDALFKQAFAALEL